MPTVITATGSKFLAVGTSLGNTALFEVGVKGYKLLGSAEHKKYGQVTSLSISRDNKYLVAGQEGGMLTVWDLYYYSELKKELVTRSKILKLSFCSEN
jgi:WD40 repeat protein